MANRTVKDAWNIKGTNPQYLIEKIIRTRIYECKYWKEECFALSAELLVDKAMEIRYVGGVYGGNVQPTPFLCLVLKMLQIQPEVDIVIEFIKNVDYKYVRALGALYMRIIGSSMDCYKYLEPLYLDYRKIRKKNRSGEFEVFHMDEYIDELLREERVYDVIMPRIQKRHVLEENNQLEPRISALDDDMEMDSDEEEEEEDADDYRGSPDKNNRDQDRPRKSPSPYRRRSRSPEKRRGERDRDNRDNRDKDRDTRGDREHGRERHRDRERDRDNDRRRSRSKESPLRHKGSDDRRRKHKHKDEDDESRRRHHKSKKSKRDKPDSNRDRDRGRGGGGGGEDREIREANELRAKLGLQPLRP